MEDKNQSDAFFFLNLNITIRKDYLIFFKDSQKNSIAPSTTEKSSIQQWIQQFYWHFFFFYHNGNQDAKYSIRYFLVEWERKKKKEKKKE